MPTVPSPSKSGGPPRSAVDLADRAHGIQGFAGDAVGHSYGHSPQLAMRVSRSKMSRLDDVRLTNYGRCRD